MKKSLIFLIVSGTVYAAQLQTVFNPFTGKPDYINASTGGGGSTLPLPAGATNYWNYPSTGTFVNDFGAALGPISINEDGSFNALAGYSVSNCSPALWSLNQSTLNLGDATGVCGTTSQLILQDDALARTSFIPGGGNFSFGTDFVNFGPTSITGATALLRIQRVFVSSNTILSGTTFYGDGTAILSTTTFQRGILLGGMYPVNSNNGFINYPGNLNQDAVTGQYNFCVNQACSSLTASNSNYCFGAGACGAITDGNVAGCGVGVGNNVAVGDDAFHFDPGCFNSGFGVQTGQYLTAGNFNTFGGARAGNGASGNNLVGGDGGTAMGYAAGLNQIGTTINSWGAFGAKSWVNGSNQMAIGSSDYPFNTIWLNSPNQTTNNTDGTSVTVQVQSSSGTDRVGGNLTLVSGPGTGNAIGSKVIISAPAAGGSGTTIQSQIQAAAFSATDTTFSGTIQGPSGVFGNALFVSTSTPMGIASGNINTIINSNNTTITGARNFLIGAGAGAAMTSGASNVCIGSQSCNKMNAEVNEVCIGDSACGNMQDVGNSGNIGIGQLAIFNTSDTIKTTAIGRAALYNNIHGTGNTAMGYNSCINSSADTSLNNLICIGAEARLDTSGTMAIGSVAEPITDVYMNSINPALIANGLSINFHAQDSSGTNKNGGNFKITAGRSSGTGTAGSFLVAISTLSVSGSNPNSAIVVSSWTTNGFTLTDNTHFNVTGSTQPTLSGCGANPSIIGTDSAFTITAGTLSAGCTATFSKPWTNTPTCVISNQSMSVVNAMTYSVSTTAVTITETGLGTSKIDVMCTGHD